MSKKRKLMLGANIKGLGNTTDGWRHPDVEPDASINIEFYKRQARILEKGLFSFVFIADGLAISKKSIPHFLNRFEPITLLSAIAASTNHIGLVGTVSTSFSEPFTIARQLMSLDHISGGRAGWNVVTSPQEGAARNHSRGYLPLHSERYEIAKEHLDVVKGLWDSWEDDAFTYQKETGQFFDPKKMHTLGFKGKHFQVQGPLNIARSKQGHPVVFQAGSSERGRGFGAENADAIYTNAHTLEEAQAFYQDMKNRAKNHGRNPEELLIFPSIDLIIGDSEEDVERRYGELAAFIPVDHAITYLARFFDDYDFHQFDVDAPFPELGDIGANAFQSTTNKIKQAAAARKLTLRQVALETVLPRSPFSGTPEHVANEMQKWHEQEAADGFVLRPFMSDTFHQFVEKVVPILQERGLYDTSYESSTLRGNLDLSVPHNRYSQTKEEYVYDSQINQ
ncbi:LLM class flavin-dependent oxidoreductase [Priestia megaterium]|uniref:LLM class flavin-dependent oxidoreductase n=1 Tax=Priestia megaterium TaxID=1404 RepID=UPI002E1AE280|nr:LLM class flavin-dependent oxidoreductase [Priestia megaterium]